MSEVAQDAAVPEVLASELEVVQRAPTPAVPSPLGGMDPRITLATAVHAGPGVYALLLGSGISSAAGIPTGWEVTLDLVRKAAAAAGAGTDQVVLGSEGELLAWWAANGGGTPLSYSNVLGELASTAAGRHHLLAQYFEASEDDRAAGLKVPTTAHRAIADLVARGSVRVILTTNFDRLLEGALLEKGIYPQVIHRSTDVESMQPLQHVQVTIIKLNGDYSDLDKLNTADELQHYPPPLANLLRQVLAQYGLIVSGWSAEYDLALREALEENESRRYPMFWGSYTAKPEGLAGALVGRLSASTIGGTTADQLFEGLVDRLDALERARIPTLTRQVAVAQLKRYIQESRDIDADDLVMAALDRAEQLLFDVERYPVMFDNPGLSVEDARTVVADQTAGMLADLDVLLHLVVVLASHGTPRLHHLLAGVVRRLIRPRPARANGHAVLCRLTFYPAALVVTAGLSASALRGRDDVVGPLLCEATALSERSGKQEGVATLACVAFAVPEDPRIVPRAGTGKAIDLAPSLFVRGELEPLLRELEPDADRRDWALDRSEYLQAIAFAKAHPGWQEFYVGSLGRRSRVNGLPASATELRQVLTNDAESPLTVALFGGNVEEAPALLNVVDEAIRYWRMHM